MPQIFQVLRCYKCFVFQVHQAKKSNKFECKMCGEKQSIKRHYGIGTAKDCRLHVQKLNGIRCEKDEIKYDNIDNDNDEPDEPICEKPAKDSKTKNSKWAAYVDREEIDKSESNESMYLEDTEVVLEVPVKRPRHNRKPTKFSVPYSNTINTICKQDAQMVDDTAKNENSNNKSSLTIDDSIHIHNKMDENKSQIESVEIIKKENDNVSNKFIPPNVHKNSKWAQYIDSSNETHEEETQEDLTHIEKTEGNACDLFSLCNDAELDNVLDL